ncbi:Aste57867_14357 [Aphanomyces stellatus]|uniref:Aste57867_14357 protein n=1 Tax=Aphanomyces stellatus TaxID=120398 RepID=A0A485L0E7_9STRA|nr:hypothetical protein As57867_014303 [Aphanomyces stellatus]VFT91180.1 Aste57867_14357 [Aphanomyces stellatus]
MEFDEELQTSLRASAGRMSPRRAVDAGTATTSLPFYENIAPGEALKRLFAWFHPKPISGARDHDGMSLDEFNSLRRCVGHPVVPSEAWGAAMLELGHEPGDVWARESEFNELFGASPPFFGIHADAHTPVHVSIMQQIAAMEEYIHFLKMLFEKFTPSSIGGHDDDDRRRILLPTIQTMQRKACVKPKLDERSWERLCNQLQSRPATGLSWLHFALAWQVNLNAPEPTKSPQYLFGAADKKPNHPRDVVQTILAEEKLAAHVARDNIVSRQALHGLLKVSSTQKQLADKEWCAILEERQAGAYGAIDGRRATEATRGTPHDIIVHNANNTMMYEVAFDEPGEIGVRVQSDYFGQCMTVLSIDGQATKHVTIQKDDIVAAIDGEGTLFDPIDSQDDEQARCDELQAKLDRHDTAVRRVVFLRQEVYFHVDQASLKVTFRVYEPIDQGGEFTIQLPPGVRAATPSDEGTSNGNITVEFDPSLHDLLRPESQYDAATSSLRVILTGAKGIKQDAFVSLTVHGIDAKSQLLAGPGAVLHVDNATTITLYDDWAIYRALIAETFSRRPPRHSSAEDAADAYVDASHTPITVEVVRGDAGVTLASDFFGQCAVVSDLSAVKDNLSKLAKDDVLSAIVFENANGVPERIQAIKPFAHGPNDNTAAHFKAISAALAARAASGQPYTLEFLHLQSHYLQDAARTTLTFTSPVALHPGSKLVVEMPTADWKAADVEAVDVTFLKPSNVRAGRVYFNTAAHTFEITIELGVVDEGVPAVVALIGVQGVPKKSAGPAEVTAVEADGSRIRLELHDQWHSFLGGRSGVAADDLVDVLTRLKTSPLDLWTILEYAHLLFAMFVDSETRTITFEKAMLLRETVLGEGSGLTIEKWTSFCRGLDATPRVGLTEHQFTCGVLDLLNFDRRFLTAKIEGHDLKRLYVHLHSVDKLFDEAIALFEEDSGRTTVHVDSLRALHKACFSDRPWAAFLNLLQKADVAKYEWTRVEFSRAFSLATKGLNPVDAWVKLHYAKLLFDEFARVQIMRKQELRDLFVARKASFELDDDVWAKLCAVIEGDHGSASSGVTVAGFVQLYPSAVLGHRDPILDWNYIQAYKMEPEPRQNRAAAMAAEIQAAPEKISVNDLAADVLDTIASTDDLAEEAVNAGIAFSRTAEVVEREIQLTEPAWTSSFESNLATRDRGILHLTIPCASELRGATADTQASAEGHATTSLEQFYVVAYMITRAEYLDHFKKAKKMSVRGKVHEFLFGQRVKPYKCATHEVWDDGQSQELVASFEVVEHQFEHYPRDNQHEYAEMRHQMIELYDKLNPYASLPLDSSTTTPETKPDKGSTRKLSEDEPKAAVVNLQAHAMISRLAHKDALAEGVVKFPDDRFRFYVDMSRPKSDRQTHLVIKLFKRTEKAKAFNPKKHQRLLQATVEVGRAEKAERVIRALLDKQKQLLVESLHLYDVNDDVTQQVAKFKRKEHEADELRARVVELRAEVAALEEEERVWRAGQRQARAKVECLGQTALPLKDYLDVLHDDTLETDDLTMLYDKDRKAVGKLLLQVKYKCGTLSRVADSQPLTATDPDRLDYPADASLKVRWATSAEFAVRTGDSLSLVRETEAKELVVGTSYFTLFWKGEANNWDIFDSSVKLYSDGQTKDEILHRNDDDDACGDARRGGWFYLPSARDLSLLPGMYRLCLIRKETIDGVNYRSSVGVSAGLNVYVGINSIHTVFGTTPLVDVKTVKCSMAIVDATTGQVQASTMPAKAGSSSWWFRACGYDAELDNTIAMTRAECVRVGRELEAPELRATKRQRLEDQLKLCEARLKVLDEAKTSGVGGIKKEQEKNKRELDALLVEWETLRGQLATAPDKTPIEHRIESIEARCKDLEDEVKGWALIRLEFEKRRSVLDLNLGLNGESPAPFSFASHMRIDFFLEGATNVAPQSNPHLNDLSHDCIVVLPQLVVETSDMLRVKILGKLQSSDSARTRQIRGQIQHELTVMLAVVRFATAPILEKLHTYKQLWHLTRELRRLRWLYVFEEVLPLFRKATPKLKKAFPAILSELIEELQVRTDELKLDAASTGGHVNNGLARRQNPIKEFGFATGDLSGVAGSLHGAVAQLVGDGDDGDVYIAKYMRRGDGSASTAGCLGELGRVGPFTIAPAEAKRSWLSLTHNQQTALVEAGFHIFVLALKYLVALLNLSFNVSFVSKLVIKISWPNINLTEIHALQAECLAALRGVLPVIHTILAWFDTFFSNLLQSIMIDLNVFKFFHGCGHGVGMLVVYVALWGTTLVLYIVIQEDLLAKVQKISAYLPIEVGKAGEDRLEQLGTILVSPVFLSIKVLILFITQQWTAFSTDLFDGVAFTQSDTSKQCVVGGLDYALQIIASVLLIIFFYILFPGIVLDMFSWVPPFDLKSDDVRRAASHNGRKAGIHDSVDNNVNLIDYGDDEHNVKWARYCSLRNLFWFHGAGKKIFLDYKYKSFYKLTETYGYVGIWFVILYVYTTLMLQSVVRVLGGLFGWRGKRSYMYPRAHLHPEGRTWTDKFCCRFNWEWKRYWVVQKVLKPLADVGGITIGLWTYDRWDVFDIEERGKNCFPMEPDNEVKQLQMMALHGKVNSLLWLPFSSAGILSYVSDCMNRGPVLSYFLNDLFLQSDRPESERKKKVRLRVLPWGRHEDDENEVYLFDTEFVTTLTKWLASMTELASVLYLVLAPMFNTSANGLGSPAAVALVAAAVAPLIEFNHQLLKSYKKLQEYSSAVQTKVQDAVQGVIDKSEAAGGAAAQRAMAQLTSAEAAVLGNASAKAPAGADALVGKLQDTLMDAQAAAVQKAQAKLSGLEASATDKLSGAGIHVQFAGASTGDDAPDEAEADDDDASDASGGDDDDDDDKTKHGDLVTLAAQPEASYIIQSDQLDVGEGVLTVSWRVNAKRRFHALDAVGMFPARSLENGIQRRTMDQCVCYRLVAETDVEPFGWKPESSSSSSTAASSHQDKVLVKRAVALEKIIQKKLGTLRRKSLAISTNQESHDESQVPRAEDGDSPTNKQPVDRTHAHEMFDHVLAHTTPHPKRLSDMLVDEIEEHKQEFEDVAMANDDELEVDDKVEGVLTAEAKSSRTVHGHVHFRPVNSNEADDHPKHEDYIFGNGAGIYPCKYGMEKYEFLYLRYVGSKLHDEQANAAHHQAYDVVDDDDDTAAHDAHAKPSLLADDFDPLNKFCSNAVAVGTFDLFIRLSSDSPLLWAGQAVNLSWNIYGVSYDILAHPNNKNCIAFYRVRDLHNARNCAKLDVVPPSAFFPNHGNGPVTGRMMVTSPPDAGMYEIRFLFNYFHAAKLHRRCQVFGLLEEHMQHERISNLFLKRDMAQSLGLLHHQEPTVWNTALLQTYAWYHPILLHLLVASATASSDVLEHPARFSRAMLDELNHQCDELVRLDNRRLQSCLESMLKPLWTPRFLDFLAASFDRSKDMTALAKSFNFVSPTDPSAEAYVAHQVELYRVHHPDKLRARKSSAAAATHEPTTDSATTNQQPDNNHADDDVQILVRLLHNDADVLKYGPSAFEQMALDYLGTTSYLPGHVDLLDDLVLGHHALLTAANLILDNAAITCCALYEPAIENAVQGFYRHAKDERKLGLFHDMQVSLKDGCRRHIGELIRAAFQTDVRTGELYGGWHLDETATHCTMRGMSVLMHKALRNWIQPKLVKHIMKTLSRRYADLTSSNVAVAKQMAKKVCRRRQVFRRANANALDRVPKTAKSVVYFLHQAQFPD